jgi:hypothetical protein
VNKIVPIEPSREMIKAFNEPLHPDETLYDEEVINAYKAMLSAAPESDHIIVSRAEYEQMKADVVRLDKIINELLAHCSIGECGVCSEIVCPYKEPLHFHHDGCPACAELE